MSISKSVTARAVKLSFKVHQQIRNIKNIMKKQSHECLPKNWDPSLVSNEVSTICPQRATFTNYQFLPCQLKNTKSFKILQ